MLLEVWWFRTGHCLALGSTVQTRFFASLMIWWSILFRLGQSAQFVGINQRASVHSTDPYIFPNTYSLALSSFVHFHNPSLRQLIRLTPLLIRLLLPALSLRDLPFLVSFILLLLTPSIQILKRLLTISIIPFPHYPPHTALKKPISLTLSASLFPASSTSFLRIPLTRKNATPTNPPKPIRLATSDFKILKGDKWARERKMGVTMFSRSYYTALVLYPFRTSLYNTPIPTLP
jgi:hypothetical protein